MFIAFDGIDGAGKTTIYHDVAKELGKNHSVQLFDMGKLGFLDNIIDKIKQGEYLCAAEIRECIYYFEGYLFSDYIAKKYIGDTNNHILIDRYVLSYLSYGPLNGMDISQIMNLCNNLILPDIYFYIDTLPNIAGERIFKKRQISKPEIGFKNVLSKDENQNKKKFIAYQEKVRQNFLAAIPLIDKKVHVIENSSDYSNTINTVMGILSQTMSLN